MAFPTMKNNHTPHNKNIWSLTTCSTLKFEMFCKDLNLRVRFDIFMSGIKCNGIYYITEQNTNCLDFKIFFFIPDSSYEHERTKILTYRICLLTSSRRRGHPIIPRSSRILCGGLWVTSRSVSSGINTQYLPSSG
jgi:hypothetical protein